MTVLANRPKGTTRAELAIASGYSVDSGGFSTALGSLRARECITPSAPIALGDKGRAELVKHGVLLDMPRGDALLEYWVGRVGTCAGSILEVLAGAYPKELTRDDLAARTNYSATSGGFSTALGKLRTLELIDGTRASDALMNAIDASRTVTQPLRPSVARELLS